MTYIIIPGTNKRLPECSIVTIPRLPGETWVVKTGWYSHADQWLNGWYFSSIPENEILPINDEDLRNLVIVSSPCPSPAPPSPCPCPPSPPCPPPIPESAKAIERYSSGTYYFEDQLLYLEEGDLYQTTKKFRSSWEFDSVSDNFQHDIELGNLITIVDIDLSDITDSISELQSDVRESNAEINTLKSAVEVIDTTIDGMKAYKYMLNFWEVFGHHFPTLSDANTFLSTLDPPVNPSLYISFINIDTDSDTYGHIFTYYPDPSDSSSLILVDIIIHNHDDRYYQKAVVDELLNGRLKIYTQESEIPIPAAEFEGQLFTWGRATSLFLPDLQLTLDPGYVYVCSRDLDNAGVYYWRNVPKEMTSYLLSLKENISNKVTSLIEESTDEQYPSAKAVYAKIAALTGEDIAYDNEYTLNGYIDYILSQFDTELSAIDDALRERQKKTLYFSDITVSDWDADETYADYSYRASVALTDVEETMLPDMVYDVAEATSGNYAPVCAAYSGGVYIYSKVDDEITIPSIKCEVTSMSS